MRLARHTEDWVRLKAVFDALEEPLRKAIRPLVSFSHRKRGIPDEVARDLASRAQDVLDTLVFEFESERGRKRVVKLLRRMNNLRKMLQAWAKTRDGDDLLAVLKAQSTRSKNPWQKYLGYRNDALQFLDYMDTDEEGRFRHESYNVVLFTSPRGDWDADSIERLRETLTRQTRLLQRAGLEAYAGGDVLAFPSKTLSGAAVPAIGRGTVAAYHLRTDKMWLAVGAPLQELLKTLVHETGHRVYYRLMGSSGRRAWEDFFERHRGAPDLKEILRSWERFQASGTLEGDHYGRYLDYYLQWAYKNDPEMAAWTTIIANQLEIGEEFHPLTGAPKKGVVPGLDQILARKDEIRVFLHPVTAYSATNASELFAEVFSHYIAVGPGTIHPLVKEAFHEALPRMKRGSTHGTSMVDGDGIPLAYPSILLRTQPDYGESQAMLPRGREDEVQLAKDFLRALGQRVANTQPCALRVATRHLLVQCVSR